MTRRLGQTPYTEGNYPYDAPRPKSGLVDDELPTEAETAANAVAMSLIEPIGRRAVSVFLGQGDYEKVEKVHGEIMANLMLESLQGFIHERGGQITYATRFGQRGEVVKPTQTTVTVAGQPRQFLRCGFLFIHLPGERAVISADPCAYPVQDVIAILIRSDRDSSILWQQWRDYARQHNYLRGQAFFADGEIIERKKSYCWDDILLPEQTKRTICTHVESFLENRLRLRELGVKARRGIILAGPPGTGKTLLGKVLADTLDASFMWVSPRHVQSTASFEEILSVARFVAPTVVFLEDLDLFGAERGAGGGGLLGELMNQLDGAVDNEDIITIASTNHLKVVENALRNRPGRFDRIIKFKAMEVGCRRRLLARLLGKADIADGDINYIVEATKDHTGAQIEELANTLYILGVDENNGDANQSANNESGEGQNADAGRIYVTRQLIDAALEDARFEKKGKLGFHAA